MTLGTVLEEVPILAEVLELGAMRMVPAGSHADRNVCARSVLEAGAVDSLYLDIIADARTSGGLLVAVPAAEAPDAVADLRAGGVSDAAIIGEAVEPSEDVIEVRQAGADRVDPRRRFHARRGAILFALAPRFSRSFLCDETGKLYFMTVPRFAFSYWRMIGWGLSDGRTAHHLLTPQPRPPLIKRTSSL